MKTCASVPPITVESELEGAAAVLRSRHVAVVDDDHEGQGSKLGDDGRKDEGKRIVDRRPDMVEL